MIQHVPDYRYTYEVNVIEIFSDNPPAWSWLDDSNWHVVELNISADDVFKRRVRHNKHKDVEGKHFRFNVMPEEVTSDVESTAVPRVHPAGAEPS